jgi:probable F420-dependent oxidoreductase
MTEVAIGVYGLQQWFDGDFAAVLDLVRRADEKGIDQVTLTDHVVMGEHTENYPYGPFPAPLDYPWYEPITFLAAVAGVTRRIRLSAGVLIAPLRPAVLLAKQLATLDVMSRGRVEIGLGLGWQKEEYDASGVPWEGRYMRLEEQVRVCKLLWSEAPASFRGSTVTLDSIHQYPRPVQKGGVPIWFGIAPTEKNFARIAELGHGWIPMEQRPDKLAPHVASLRAAFKAAGRDPASVSVRAIPQAAFTPDGAPDLEGTLANVPALTEIGVTMIELLPIMFCRGPADFDSFLDRVVQLQRNGK